jgi:DNA-binding NtrC family response regulator
MNFSPQVPVVSPASSAFSAALATVPPRPARRPATAPRLVGSSPAATKLEREIARSAHFDSCILLSGETGSGKEGVARAIHAAGPRSDRPFVAINCAALTPTLAESQLFGHVKGSFTGAVGTALGVFRAGDGGVVFLDEIGELPLEVQPKLLRVIQQREVTPVGSTDVFPFDVQLLAATNRDLAAEVEQGTFRADLFYRLNTIEIEVPALRDRASDIPLFVRHFSSLLATRLGREPWSPDAETLARMLRHRWPGNVRQLAQFVERVYVFGTVPELPDDGQPLPPDLSAEVLTAAASPSASSRAASAGAGEPTLPVFNLDELRRIAVRQALAVTGGHKGKAAALLGVHINTMTKFVAEAAAGLVPTLGAGRPRRPR